MSEKNIYRLSLVILSVLMVVLALNYWPNADDFCFRAKVDREGLMLYLTNYYHHWSGRVFTLWILGLIIKILPLEHSNLVSGLFVLLFIYSSFVFSKFLKRHLNLSPTLTLTLTLFLFWFGLRAIIGEIVYWPTGAATYLIPFVLGLIWMLSFEDDLKKDYWSWFSIICHFIFSLIVGNGIEVLSPILCTYGFLFLIFEWNNLPRKTLLISAFKIVGIILGTLVLVLAPGNFERAQNFPQGIHFDLVSLFSNLGNVTWVFFSFTKTLLMYSFFTAVLIYLLNPEKLFDKIKLRRLSFILFISALSSLIPMTAIDVHFTTRRTTFYFSITMALALIYWLLSFQNKIRFKLSLKKSQALFLLVILVTAGSIAYDISGAIPIRKKFLARHQQLLNYENKNDIVLLDSLTLKAPKSLFYEEIVPDENYWVNSCIARYYGVNRVKLKESP